MTVPKLGMEEVRRRQLIEATIASIHEVGFARVTLQAIAQRAGVSAGLVSHYFHDKEGLLEATLRSLAAELGRGVAARLRRARDPIERLEAIIDSNLDPTQFDPRIAKVWLNFWGQVTHSPRLRRVQLIYERRLLGNLRHAFRQLLPLGEAQLQAEAMAAMIDGLWLRAALASDRPNHVQARAIAKRFLYSQLDPVEVRTRRLDEALNA